MKKLLKTILCLSLTVTSINLYAQTGRELQLPDVPSDLRDVKSRAAYVVSHFWDNMDFNDTLALNDNDFMEQNFANFAGLMPLADIDAIMPATARNLLTSLKSNPKAYLLMLDLAEIYLYDYASPLRYELAYVPFIQQALSDGIIDDARKARFEYTLEEAAKNAPGSKTPDIELVDAAGDTKTLSAVIPGNTKYSLLYLYDPDCSHCTELIAALKDDPIISAALANNLLSILAVNIMGMDAMSTAGSLIPSDWISLAAVDTEFNETEAFNLPSLPVIYLIDPDMTVILKEANPQQLLSKLAAEMK
ncbi:MAG: DUF5106 domain-containing protein [Paramuribaculum sp.]|nr:DUF5106 domain-containing protein [Paramuribaculum sp.]